MTAVTICSDFGAPENKVCQNIIEWSHSLIFPQKIWRNTYIQKPAHRRLYQLCSKFSKLGATKISFSRLDKQTVVHPDDGMLFSAKKKWAIKPWKDMGNITHITEWKKRNCKDYITYDSNYMTFWKKSKIMETIQRSDLLVVGVGVERDKNRQNTENFRRVKVLCLIL